MQKKISKAVTEFTKGSKASSESKNANRSISSIEKMSRKASGNIPDLVFKYGDNELGCVEIGLVDQGTNGTKEIHERSMKTPKTMRDSCWKIMNDYDLKDPRNIKLISYVISGHYFTINIMTFKHGSVGLVYSSNRIKIPTTIKEMSRLLPHALRYCYSTSKIIKSTVKYLDAVCDEKLVPEAGFVFYLPLSL